VDQIFGASEALLAVNTKLLAAMTQSLARSNAEEADAAKSTQSNQTEIGNRHGYGSGSLPAALATAVGVAASTTMDV
jgi:hypothetical protein